MERRTKSYFRSKLLSLYNTLIFLKYKITQLYFNVTFLRIATFFNRLQFIFVKERREIDLNSNKGNANEWEF